MVLGWEYVLGYGELCFWIRLYCFFRGSVVYKLRFRVSGVVGGGYMSTFLWYYLVYFRRIFESFGDVGVFVLGVVLFFFFE